MKTKGIVISAALLGLIAVVLGALGAHALKEVLDNNSLNSFKTGVRYQAWHALALLVLPSLPLTVKHKGIIALLWLLGTVLFSGSIYLLSLSGVWDMKLSFLGPVTPLGGLLMISGWFFLFLKAFSIRNNPQE